MKFYQLLIPYHKTIYVLDLEKEAFLEKLETQRTDLEKKYQPGRHFLRHYSSQAYFYYKNRKSNPGNNSGGFFTYYYYFHKNKTYIKSVMIYPFIINLFIFLLAVIPLVIFLKYLDSSLSILGFIITLSIYSIFNLVFQLEAWIIRDIFEASFTSNIIEKLSEMEFEKKYHINDELFSIHKLD